MNERDAERQARKEKILQGNLNGQNPFEKNTVGATSGKKLTSSMASGEASIVRKPPPLSTSVNDPSNATANRSDQHKEEPASQVQTMSFSAFTDGADKPPEPLKLVAATGPAASGSTQEAPSSTKSSSKSPGKSPRQSIIRRNSSLGAGSAFKADPRAALSSQASLEGEVTYRYQNGPCFNLQLHFTLAT